MAGELLRAGYDDIVARASATSDYEDGQSDDLPDPGSAGRIHHTQRSREEAERTAKAAVGPGEARPGETQADVDREYWASLARLIGRAGVSVTDAQLRKLRHDVELGKRLTSRLKP